MQDYCVIESLMLKLERQNFKMERPYHHCTILEQF